MAEKHCRKCGTVKPVTEFNNDKSRPDGKFPWCKVCKRGDDAGYRAKNVDRIAENSRRWYAANRDRAAETKRVWLEANRDRKAEMDAAYYAANRDRILAYTREWNANREGNRPADKPWPKSPCGYSGAHDRVKAIYGRASAHQCIDCGGSASDWSYRGGAESELSVIKASPRGELIEVAYSVDPEDYDPRCIPCHRKYDMNRKVSA